MHIVNSEAEDSTIDETFRITRIIQDVLNIVGRSFAMEFDTSSSYYYRFITHLKFFARRVLGWPCSPPDGYGWSGTSAPPP